jgi:hypothetical protein
MVPAAPGPLEDVSRDYRVAFLRYLPQRDEAALLAAYEAGRRAVATGVSLLELVEVHHAVLGEVLSETKRDHQPEVIARAADLLCELLAVVEVELSLRRDP